VAVQFRQIGVPDARTTNTEVRQQLRCAQQRTESLLNRPQLPRPPTLLSALSALQRAIQAAYVSLPLQRLVQMQQRLEDLHDDVDRGVYFDTVPDVATTIKTLRRFYSDLTGLLVDLAEPRQPSRSQEDNPVLDQFLKHAQQRGWRVPDQQRPAATEQDGFVQSVSYLQKIAVAPQNLLAPGTEFGVTTGSIVLMTEHPIPESTLNSWADEREVYIVFGHYVVLPQVQLLGVLPHLAIWSEDDININRFVSIAKSVQTAAAKPKNLIQYPRRVRHHYYCPLINIAATDQRYFRTWDLLVQQENNANTTNRVKW